MSCLCPSPRADFLQHPGLKSQRDLAHFVLSELGKAGPEAKGSGQPGQTKMWSQGVTINSGGSHQTGVGLEGEAWGPTASQEVL